jgi:hypothetical protein
LETRLPIAVTGPNAAAADTHVDDNPFAEDLGVDDDEHSELPNPPPHQRQPFNQQGMRGNQNHHNQHMFAMMILLLKLNFLSLFLMARMMPRLI